MGAKSGSRTARASVVAAGLLLAALASGAAEIEGVGFAEEITVADRRLALRGTGLLRYRVLFKGYVAALYLETETPMERILDDVSKRLEIEYFWDIDGEDFGRAAEAVLARNVDAATLERLRPQIETLHASYEDVKAGDRYALTYVPGRGTELAKNGVRRAAVPGAEFAEAYFGIWLGDQPIDRGLRDQLLGRR